jgi:DNA-binding IscR family transcriptional regulator
MNGTNPVVFRRTLAGLREAGFVRSEKGHGGGWMLAKPLAKVSLLDVQSHSVTPRRKGRWAP